MKSILIISTLFSVFLNASDLSDIDSYAKVPLMALIVNPEKYHGQKVNVSGVLDFHYSDSVLIYVNSEYMQLKFSEYSVGLGRDFRKSTAKKQGESASVFGVFYLKQCSNCNGHPKLYIKHPIALADFIKVNQPSDND